MFTKKFISCAVTLVMLVSVSESMAQQQQQQAPAPQNQQVEVNVSDKKMKEFVSVYTEVISISEKYQPKLQEAKDPEQSDAIIQQAQAEMVEKVNNSKISVEEYNEILAAIPTDKKLQKKFQKYLD